MLTVMMGTLAFFVIVTVLFTAQQGVDVTLPSTEGSTTQEVTPDPLVVELNQQGRILLDNQSIGRDQLAQQTRAYLGRNPKGAVLLKPDPRLPYEQVVQLLGEMRNTAGDRVSGHRPKLSWGRSMQFKQQKGSQVPEVNLVPMMDVLMTVLTFFIIVSMTLTGQQFLNVNLPRAGTGISNQQEPEPPLVVGLNQQGQTILRNQPVSEVQLTQEMQTYLQNNLKGTIILQADRELSYERVEEVLGIMRDIGGDRVSLGVDQS